MNQKVINKIRWLGYIPLDFCDGDIRKCYEGSFLHRRAEIAVALDDLRDAIRDALPRWLQRWL